MRYSSVRLLLLWQVAQVLREVELEDGRIDLLHRHDLMSAVAAGAGGRARGAHCVAHAVDAGGIKLGLLLVAGTAIDRGQRLFVRHAVPVEALVAIGAVEGPVHGFRKRGLIDEQRHARGPPSSSSSFSSLWHSRQPALEFGAGAAGGAGAPARSTGPRPPARADPAASTAPHRTIANPVRQERRSSCLAPWGRWGELLHPTGNRRKPAPHGLTDHWAYFAAPVGIFCYGAALRPVHSARAAARFALPECPAGRASGVIMAVGHRTLRGMAPVEPCLAIAGGAGSAAIRRWPPRCSLVFGCLSLGLAAAAFAPATGNVQNTPANSTAACLECHSDPKLTHEEGRAHGVTLCRPGRPRQVRPSVRSNAPIVMRASTPKAFPTKQPAESGRLRLVPRGTSAASMPSIPPGGSPRAGGRGYRRAPPAMAPMPWRASSPPTSLSPGAAGGLLRPVPPAGPRSVPGLRPRPRARRRHERGAGLP